MMSALIFAALRCRKTFLLYKNKKVFYILHMKTSDEHHRARGFPQSYTLHELVVLFVDIDEHQKVCQECVGM